MSKRRSASLSSSDVNPGPSVDRRSSDPLAAAIYAQLRDAAEADLQLVYRALERHLAGRVGSGSRQPDPERVEHALAAMDACEEAIGRLPSKQLYETWYTRAGKTSGWPSATFVTNTFGSWAKAVEAAGGTPTHDLLSRRLLANGSAFSSPLLCELLRACADELGQDWLTFPVYRGWAVKELRRSPRRFASLPLSRGPFQRLGGWTEAVEAAGLVPYAPGDFASRAGIDSRHMGDDDLLEMLREEAAACVGHLTRSRFDAGRRAKEEAAAAQGTRIVRVRSPRIVNRFGSFADALLKAGLIEDEERRFRSFAYCDRIKNEDALLTLAEALDEHGDSLSQRQYAGWRKRRLADGLPRGRHPSAAWFQQHFGSWAAAKLAARTHTRAAADRDGAQRHDTGALHRRAA